MSERELDQRMKNVRYTWQIKTLLGTGLTDDQADAIVDLLDELEQRIFERIMQAKAVAIMGSK
jgi:hypothetical protein